MFLLEMGEESFCIFNLNI